MTDYTPHAILIDLIVIIILAILFLRVLMWVPVIEAAEYEIWWRMPGQKYYQKCCEINDEGISEVRHIPEGAIIVIRDKQRWVLVPVTRGRE